jgi:putative ABC transport system ATP-binding protein
MLKMDGVTKIYSTGLVETRALRDFSLEVEEGEFVTITGPSGSGKTTFLNVAGLLDGFDEGKYFLDGLDVSRLTDREMSRIRNEKIGFIFQSFNLIPDLDVFDNVDVPLRYRRLPAKERRERIERAIAQVGLTSRLRHLPSQLSGGQQQRVAIARALAMRPNVLLCDEITSALDPELVNEVLRVVEQLAKDGMTLILVTHEMRFARDVGTKLIFMHQGKVHEEGPPKQLFASPGTAELKQFVGMQH